MEQQMDAQPKEEEFAYGKSSTVVPPAFQLPPHPAAGQVADLATNHSIKMPAAPGHSFEASFINPYIIIAPPPQTLAMPGRQGSKQFTSDFITTYPHILRFLGGVLGLVGMFCAILVMFYSVQARPFAWLLCTFSFGLFVFCVKGGLSSFTNFVSTCVKAYGDMHNARQ